MIIDLAALVAGGAVPTEGAVPTGIEASVALTQLAAWPCDAKRVLVAAGPDGAAGEDLAERATSVATHLLVVGRHARSALRRGAARGSPGCTIVVCREVEDAQVWVDAETGPADAVIWLPIPFDHVP